MRFFVNVLWAIALTVPAWAETPVFSQPTLGTVFDADYRTLRLVTGVPGAAGRGRVLAAELLLASACLDSGSRSGIGWTKDGGAVALTWGLSGAKAEPLSDAFAVGGRCAVAGGSAVLAGVGGVQMWSGLSGPARLSATYSTEMLGGVPEHAAMSGDGTTAAVILQSGAVIEIGAGVRDTGLTGRAISYVGHDLFVLSKAGQVVKLSAGGPAVVAAADDPESALSADENWIVVIGRNTGRVTVYSQRGEKVAGLETSCRPSEIQPFGIPGLFYIADRNEGAWILEAAGEPSLQRLSTVPEGSR